jgi:gluconokinase
MGTQSLVIMGVAGCGKSTLAVLIARERGLQLVEGDDHHPVHNRQKMQAGIPLTDEDRAGWLDRLAQSLLDNPDGQVVTCSALRRLYRDRLRAAAPEVRFVYLEIEPEEALRRVSCRGSHFFGPGLVESQFATLESPAQEPGVLCLRAVEPPEQLAAQVAAWLRQGELG